MENTIRKIALGKLLSHPDNPNRMSRSNFAKLVRNIKKTGRYEPLVVRPAAGKRGFFEVINGHHRRDALRELGQKKADCVVWKVDDEQTDVLLTTLNRLGGTDGLEKKLALLRRLVRSRMPVELGKLLPMTAKQIERLSNIGMPGPAAGGLSTNARFFANPMVFFVDDRQQGIINRAIGLVECPNVKMGKAARHAAALTHIAEHFLEEKGGE